MAVLLPPLLLLKTVNCKYNHYLNTVYYSKLLVFELFVSSVLPQYFLCSCAFLQPYLPWKSSKYYIFRCYVCILSYPKCKAHAPYCHKEPLLQYSILPPHILIGRIFQEKLLAVFICFDFFTTFETFFIQRELSEMCVGVHVKYPFVLSDLNKIWILLSYFPKNLKIKYYGNLPIQSRVVPCARRKRWTDIPKHTVAFPNFANSPNELKLHSTNVLNFQVKILYGSSRPG